MTYRPEIDGLRAVAILPVVLLHAGLPGMPAGFLGVDVFFVISGFLITSILLAEFAEDRFSVLGFYERRARRIFPALALMLLLSVPVAWMFMLPSQLRDFGQSMVATVGFAANFYFWLTQDYWAQSAEITPLIHLWSLGIEEQFYFVFPLLLALLHRRPKLLVAALLTLIAASVIAMLIARVNGHGASAFYLLPFRSWELLAGAIAAVASRQRATSPEPSPWLPGVLLGVIVASYALLGPTSNPFLLHVPVVTATALLLALCGSCSPVGRCLSWPAAVWIGKVSYSLYLFHQPVLALARLRFGLELTPVGIVSSLLIIGLLSTVSYRFVEAPFRQRASISGRALVASMVSVALLVGAFGFAARLTKGFREIKVAQMSPAGRDALRSLQEAAVERKALWARLLADAGRNFEPAVGRRVLFVGDSLSEDLFVVASLSDCGDPPLQFRRLPLDNECIESQASGRTGVGGMPCAEELRRFVESSLLRDSDCIVIAAAWLETARSLSKFLDLSGVQGKRIVVYEPHGFTSMSSLIAYMDRESLPHASRDLRKYCFVSRHDRTMQSNLVLHEIAARRDVVELRGFDSFCDDDAETCQLFDEEGRPLIVDQAHLSIAGARWMGLPLCGAIRAAFTGNR